MELTATLPPYTANVCQTDAEVFVQYFVANSAPLVRWSQIAERKIYGENNGCLRVRHAFPTLANASREQIVSAIVRELNAPYATVKLPILTCLLGASSAFRARM